MPHGGVTPIRRCDGKDDGVSQHHWTVLTGKKIPKCPKADFWWQYCPEHGGRNTVESGDEAGVPPSSHNLCPFHDPPCPACESGYLLYGKCVRCGHKEEVSA